MSLDSGSNRLFYERTEATPATKAQIKATDIDGATQTIEINIGAVTDPFVFADSAAYDVPAGTVGTTYTSATALTATGGTAPYTFTIDGTVPAGLSINSSNQLVYARPAVATDSTTATIKVTDSASKTKTINIIVGKATAVGAPLEFFNSAAYDVPAGTVGTTYTSATALTATGGTTPYTFTVDPAVTGLSINSSNQLVYARPADASDSTTATNKVTDKAGTTKTITINVGAATKPILKSVSATVTAPVAGAKPSFTATPGESDKYDVTIRYWKLMISGTISGPELTDADTYIAGETYGVYITVTAKDRYALDNSTRCLINGEDRGNNGGNSSHLNYSHTFEVGGNSEFAFKDYDQYDIPSTDIGKKYTSMVSLVATGGEKQYTYEIVTPVPGLSLDSGSNRLSYIRNEETSLTTAQIKATDKAGATQTITIKIGAVTDPIVFENNAAYNIPAGTVGTTYTSATTLTATGGTAPYTFSKDGAPDWLTVSSDGKINGTRPADAASATTAYIIVTDSTGKTKSINIKVGAVTEMPGSLTFADSASYDVPAGTVGTTYTSATAFTAAGGTAPYTFAIDGTVPAGLSINADKKLVYVRPETATAATTATIKVTDSASATKTITINIGAVTPPSAYNIISGANAKWAKDSNSSLTITSNAPYNEFSAVEVDGAVIAAENYTKAEGSTIITLKASYLKTLSVGTHTISIVSGAARATTSFTVGKASDTVVHGSSDVHSIAAESSNGEINPNTGAESNISLLTAIMLVSSGCAFCKMHYGKKKKEQAE